MSGGAPSPPLMMEDPGRPPSGPVGRRSEPFGEFLFRVQTIFNSHTVMTHAGFKR